MMPVVRNCRIADNTAECGGGVAVTAFGGLRLEHCIVESNVASRDGGGALCFDLCDLTMLDCDVRHNRARSGGGILCVGTFSTDLSRVSAIVDCRITDNVCDMPSNSARYGEG